jgi:hypothetical protein
MRNSARRVLKTGLGAPHLDQHLPLLQPPACDEPHRHEQLDQLRRPLATDGNTLYLNGPISSDLCFRMKYQPTQGPGD